MLLFRWFVSMTMMASSYRRGVAPWQTAGVGILSCSRTFNVLPVILLPRLRMTLAAFWTVGCEFEGQQRALADAWFAVYPAIGELLMLYFSVLDLVAKVSRRRMSDAWFGPSLLACALLHFFRRELAQSRWLGVDSRIATAVSSDEFDSLLLIDVLHPDVALRLNGNITLLFYGKILLLALNAVPLLFSENMTTSGTKLRSCAACEIEKTLALRASNTGGIGRSCVYAFAMDAPTPTNRLFIRPPKRVDGVSLPTLPPALTHTAVVPFHSVSHRKANEPAPTTGVGPTKDETKVSASLVGYEVNRLGYLVFGERFLVTFDDWYLLTSLAPLRVLNKLWNHRVVVFDVEKTSDGGGYVAGHSARLCRLDDPALQGIPWYDITIGAFQ